MTVERYDDDSCNITTALERNTIPFPVKRRKVKPYWGKNEKTHEEGSSSASSDGSLCSRTSSGNHESGGVTTDDGTPEVSPTLTKAPSLPSTTLSIVADASTSTPKRTDWDLFVPIFCLAQLCLTFLGPVLIPRFYLLYIMILYIFGAIEFPHQMIKGIRFARAVVRKSREASTVMPFKFTHVIVLPNYNEPFELLSDTLSDLASHKNAKKSYVVVLAMEEAEHKSLEKGWRLKHLHQNHFSKILVTHHPRGIPREHSGKAANVNFAVRCVDRILTGGKAAACPLSDHNVPSVYPRLDASEIVLTITDADAQIPELYFQEVDLSRQKDSTHTPYGFYEPPMWFARNLGNVPALVRAADSIWSMFVMINLSNPRGIIFPCSTYSVTLDLIRAAGYWDTDALSVAEDMHSFIKCFIKTNGAARGTPIHVPIFLTNVETDGYWGTIKARFTQGIRHMASICDTGYVLTWIFSSMSGRNSQVADSVPSGLSTQNPLQPASITDRILFVLCTMEAHLVPSLSWGLYFAPWLGPILNPAFPHIPGILDVVVFLHASTTLSQALLILTFEWMHHCVRQRYPRTERRRWYHVFDWLLLPMALFSYVTLPITLSSWKIVLARVRGRTHAVSYVVTAKGYVAGRLVGQAAP